MFSPGRDIDAGDGDGGGDHLGPPRIPHIFNLKTSQKIIKNIDAGDGGNNPQNPETVHKKQKRNRQLYSLK